MPDLELTEEELKHLSSFALVAFAARCVRRIMPLVPLSATSPQVIASINGMEEIASGSGPYFRYHGNPLVAPHPSEAYPRDSVEQRTAEIISDIMEAVSQIRIGLTMYEGGPKAMASGTAGEWYARKAIEKAVGLLREKDSSHTVSVFRDFEVLLEYDRDPDNRYEHGPPLIPVDFFVTRTTFDVTKIVHEAGSVLEISSRINARLIEYFRQYPKRMFDLSPRQFEELVAELWSRFGWDVELTSRCRDGGRDVIAIKYTPSAVRFLIECKRWQQNVGVQVVRSLHGVLNDEQANKAILATTARFTHGAKEHLDRHPWRLEGRDFDGLIDWLEVYHRIAMAGDIGCKHRVDG